MVLRRMSTMLDEEESQAFITEFGFRFDSFVRVPYDDVHPRADSPQSASAPPSPEG